MRPGRTYHLPLLDLVSEWLCLSSCQVPAAAAIVTARHFVHLLRRGFETSRSFSLSEMASWKCCQMSPQRLLSFLRMPSPCLAVISRSWGQTVGRPPQVPLYSRCDRSLVQAVSQPRPLVADTAVREDFIGVVRRALPAAALNVPWRWVEAAQDLLEILQEIKPLLPSMGLM